MPEQLPKTYDPKGVEGRIYSMWVDGGYFKGEADKNKKPFSIVIPPPNVTGQLHLGHAFNNTLQDILIRTKRMQGYAALWMPGTDHAGIATQIKVEESLRKEGKTRYDLGREAFVERVWEWKRLYGGRIIEQLKTMGSSCDWDRERFTMDEGCSRAVREVFVNLYEKGLIYKGSRIINWCPHCKTALSDAEVEYTEQQGHFWYIKYPVKENPGEFVLIATTRPETMLGDTAVAVNPDDERYTHLVGKTLILPLMDREIPVVADEYVEKEFGTGCVKITPSHDPNDFEVAQRHGLEQILILDGEARINENGGKYKGLDRYEAREAVLKDLESLGLLVKTEEHRHNVGQCYRCSTTVEPLTSAQWFVKMQPLAQPAIKAVEDGEIRFVPERFSKIYINWMDNVHDWCISRQLWWGHRIPAFTCADCGHVMVTKEDPTVCAKCGGKHISQEEDVLDTWFSSALWPFSTMGWPEKTKELEFFYPNSVLVTAYDIIFFWVARMIFSGIEHMGEIPFPTVFIHGLIRDGQGRKMSKSAGNGVDPMDVIDTYGADALRFTLVTGNSPGNDVRFYNERCEAMRNFCNKIWNASRFVLMNIDEGIDASLPGILEQEDKWILSRLNRLTREVTECIDKYELGIAAQKLYDFIWDDFCDWYIELVKSRLQQGGQARENAGRVLCSVLTQVLALLHPFMPFITEEIWQALPHEGKALMVSKWPEYVPALDFPQEEAAMERIMALIRSVRNRRAEMNVPPSKKTKLYIVTDKIDEFEAGLAFLSKLAYASSVEITSEMPENTAGMVSAVTGDAQAFIPLSELVDTEKETQRLEKERKNASEELSKLQVKLSNKGFTEKAPENVVRAERERLEKLEALLVRIDESLKQLKA